jgi:hypothetical protein
MSTSLRLGVTSHYSIGSRPRSRWNSFHFFLHPNNCPSPFPPCGPPLCTSSLNCPLHDRQLPFDCCFHCCKPMPHLRLPSCGARRTDNPSTRQSAGCLEIITIIGNNVSPCRRRQHVHLSNRILRNVPCGARERRLPSGRRGLYSSACSGGQLGTVVAHSVHCPQRQGKVKR